MIGTTIHLEPRDVPAHLRGGYTGKRFQVVLAESVDVPAGAGLWDNGSKESYRVVRLADGAAMSATDESASPWDANRQARTVTLEPGFAVVREIRGHSYSALSIYIRPEDAAPMLPAPVEGLTAHMRLVLKTTCECKASCGGRDRYQMAEAYAAYGSDEEIAAFPARNQWDFAKAELIKRGYLNKAGAATPGGRNVNAANGGR